MLVAHLMKVVMPSVTLLKLLYKAVHQLNDIEKALVFMYLEDKDYTEIAETLGISEVNARVKMNRIKGKLKKIVNP